MDDKKWGGCAPDVLRDEIASALKKNGYLTAKVSVEDDKCVVRCGLDILDDELFIINRHADIVRERYGVTGHYWVRVENGELVVWVW